MPRPRTIHPSFPEQLQRASHGARLLAYILPLACDDAGRATLNLEALAKMLYPNEGHVPYSIGDWMHELELFGWIERYRVGEQDYFRIVKWREHQKVNRPTPSRLPRSPREPVEDSRTPESLMTHESLRILQGRDRNPQQDQALEGEGTETHEAAVFFESDLSEAVSRGSVVTAFQRIQKKAEEAGSHIAALQATVMLAKFSGIAPPAKVAVDRSTRTHTGTRQVEPAAPSSQDDDLDLPSPAAAHGLPVTNDK